MDLITTPAVIGQSPPANSIVHSTEASLTDRAPSAPVHLVQYDDTLPLVAVALTANGQPYTVPSGAAVNVRLAKPDGTYVYNPAYGVSADGQTVYIAITPQMTVVAGKLSPIIEIVLNGDVAGTGAFVLDIDANPVPENAIESSDEYKTIQELVAEVQQAAQLVQDQAANLQNVTDNLTAIQNAAANAQAAAASAEAAQVAAQQALGFRTFFSAVSPDANGDLDPSRPMTTPTAASVTVKSKGDRIQSVQANGFTRQAGTGDPSPTNVQAISTAGMKLRELVYDGSSDEAWQLTSAPADPTTGGMRFSITIPDSTLAGKASERFCTVCVYGGTYSGSYVFTLEQQGTGINMLIRLGSQKTVAELKSTLQSSPIKVYYLPSESDQITGLYIPIQAQGHEYRCQMLELAETLGAGDNVQSNVPSGCDVKYELTGNESYIRYSSGIAFSKVFSGTLLNPKAYCTDFTQVGLGNQKQGGFWFGYGDANVYCFINPTGTATTDEQLQRFKEKVKERYAAGNPITFWYRSTAYTEENDIPVELEAHANGHVYAHDPVTLVAVPYTEADATAAQQLASTPSMLPYIDSADVPMLLDDAGEAEAATTEEPATEADTSTAEEPAVQPMSLAATLSTGTPVAGTYIVSSQDGTTVLVSLKAMQDGGDAVTVGGQAPDSFAPASHASSENTYGVGTAALYGHVMLSDTAGDSDATDGVAATPKAVKAVAESVPIVEMGTVQVQSMAPQQDLPIDVTFSSPMPDTNYAVALSLYLGGGYWSVVRYRCTSKSTTGFSIGVRNDASDGSTDPISIDWIAIHK